MSWFQKLWKRIIESDNQQYIDYINILNNDKDLLNEQIQESNELITKLENENETLFKQITETNHLLAEQVIKIASLKTNKTVLDVLIPKNVKYRWKPKKYTLLRHSLNKFSTDSIYQGKYLSFLITQGLKDKYESEKDLIINTYLIAKTYLQGDNDNYDTDKESFGVNEYWLTPQESFDYYVGGNEGDCDDYSAFIYGCLVTSLLHFGYNLDNLFRADVNIMGSGGHAVIEWWSSEDQQFLHLESTFSPTRAYKVWSSKRNICNSVYTDVMRFFNEKQEYVVR